MKVKDLPFFIFISLTALAAIILGCWKINQPGLYYDEMLFGNAAVGGKTNDFINLRLLNVPILLMDYIGAVKAWIYYPIFSIFPVNYLTVRLPAILLGVAGGLALVGALRKGFGRSAAMAGAVMILLDPTLITHSRVDWGPNALMFFFRGVLVYSLVSWVRTRNLKWAWLALAVGALGIFDKLNFIWIVFAFFGALVLVYSDKLREFRRTYPRQVLVMAGLGVAGLGFTIARAVKLAEHTNIGWPERISAAFRLIRLTLAGGGALDFISGEGLRLEQWIWPGYLLAFVIGLLGIKFLFKNKTDKTLYQWTIVSVLLLAAAFIFTKTATGPHHSSVLSGPWQFALAPLVGAFWDEAKLHPQRTRLFALWSALILIIAANVISNIVCIRAFASPTNPNWDTANTSAASFANQHPDACFVSTDWGIGTQVIAITKGHVCMTDAWPAFSKQEDAVHFINDLPKDKDIYIYTRLPEFENFKGHRANLLYALEMDHRRYEVNKTYNNQQGKPMIEILKLAQPVK